MNFHSQYSYQTELEVLAIAIRQKTKVNKRNIGKEIKGMQARKRNT